MKYNDSLYKMIEDTRRQAESFMKPFKDKDYEHIYGTGFKDISDSLIEREKLLRSLATSIDSRYQNITELAQREAARYGEFAITPGYVDEMTNAKSVIAGFLEGQDTVTRVVAEAVGTSKYWQTEINTYKSLFSEAEAQMLALKTHYSDVAELSLIAQEHMLVPKWDEIASTFGVPSESMFPVESTFSNMLKSYNQLFGSFQQAEHKIASFPPFVSKLPPVEIITESDLFESISEKEWEEPTEGVREVEDRITDDIEETLEELLVRLDPDIIQPWKGAKQALKSKNDDRSRHVIVSLREIVTHVLHQIAPDDDIHSWSSDRSLYSNGRPTRAARLFFVCRDVNHGPFQQFVNRDVSAHMELIRLLQRGTHKLSVDLTENQLRFLVLRTESLLRFILEIWNSNS